MSRKKRKHTRKESRREVKQKAVNYKGGKCEACNYDKCIAALTFHHCDPREKRLEISRSLNINWNALKKELDKCKLLCMNCHCEVENGVLDGYS